KQDTQKSFFEYMYSKYNAPNLMISIKKYIGSCCRLILVVVLLPAFITAQDFRIIRLDTTRKKADTAFIGKKIKAGLKLTYTHPDQALQLLYDAWRLSRQEKEHGSAMDALIHMGAIYTNKGN